MRIQTLLRHLERRFVRALLHVERGFYEVDEALGERLSDLIWSGDPEALTLTKNAQPALMATSLAGMRALEAEGVTMAAVDYVAGHSLGEYSALAASGAISVPDLSLIHI